MSKQKDASGLMKLDQINFDAYFGVKDFEVAPKDITFHRQVSRIDELTCRLNKVQALANRIDRHVERLARLKDKIVANFTDEDLYSLILLNDKIQRFTRTVTRYTKVMVELRGVVVPALKKNISATEDSLPKLFNRELAKRLKRIRTERGLNQVEVCAQLGITQSAYSQYEHFQSVPPPFRLYQLAKILGVTADEILGLTE